MPCGFSSARGGRHSHGLKQAGAPACARSRGGVVQMDHKRRTAWVAVALVLLAVSGLYAQTTGRLLGQIADQSGAPVPGVTVTVTSPQLQGSLTAITDGNGDFRFPT